MIWEEVTVTPKLASTTRESNELSWALLYCAMFCCVVSLLSCKSINCWCKPVPVQPVQVSSNFRFQCSLADIVSGPTGDSPFTFYRDDQTKWCGLTDGLELELDTLTSSIDASRPVVHVLELHRLLVQELSRKVRSTSNLVFQHYVDQLLPDHYDCDHSCRLCRDCFCKLNIKFITWVEPKLSSWTKAQSSKESVKTNKPIATSLRGILY